MDTINLKKLAEHLSLSVSTVSKAFRNSYDINPQTRERILALARELNYQPNPMASSLRTQKSMTIAVIIPEIANNFFTQAINGIESVAREKNYHVLIYITHEEGQKEIAFTSHLQSGRVDGVLLSMSDGKDNCKHLDELHKKEIPVVFFDRVYDAGGTTRVTTNDFESGYDATKHLIEQGCRKILHLFFSSRLSISEKRKQGYIQALKDHHIPYNENLVLDCSGNKEKDLLMLVNCLAMQQPDGIFSSFEKLALLAYEACASLKLTIPDQVKLISFSNMEAASLLCPSLTTITQPAYEMGKKAASVLFDALEKNSLETPDEQVVIDSVLVKRKSTSNEQV